MLLSNSTANKQAVQVNIPKPTARPRLLTMLEESFKAIEGLVCRRRPAARCNAPLYGSCNLAGDPGWRAASEVLFSDTLLCEDSVRHSRPMCCMPEYYDKFFNKILLSVADAVDESVGVPESFRSFYAEVFSCLSGCRLKSGSGQ